jgi:hypothetical protein
MTTLQIELSAESIRKVKEQIEEYAASLPAKSDECCRRLGEIGMGAALKYVKIDTSELAGGISVQRIGNADYLVVSVGGHAAFVEFGTGVVGAGTYEGELPADWDYDLRETPEAHDPNDPTAWYYYDEDGIRHKTRGQKAASYMAKSSEEMRQKVLEIAKEVYAFD